MIAHEELFKQGRLISKPGAQATDVGVHCKNSASTMSSFCDLHDRGNDVWRFNRGTSNTGNRKSIELVESALSPRVRARRASRKTVERSMVAVQSTDDFFDICRACVSMLSHAAKELL